MGIHEGNFPNEGDTFVKSALAHKTPFLPTPLGAAVGKTAKKRKKLNKM
jgi:hypothetical protein